MRLPQGYTDVPAPPEGLERARRGRPLQPSEVAAVQTWIGQLPPAALGYLADLGAVLDDMPRRSELIRELDPTARHGQVRVGSSPVLMRLRDLASSGQLGVCAHVRALAPTPAAWLAYAPRKVRCADCTRTEILRIAGGREDRRCDDCGRIFPGLAPHMVQLQPMRVQGLLIPVVASFGLCGGCQVKLEVQREGDQ
jgi:hypothetical protein